MKRGYNFFSISRKRRPSRFFLIPLFLTIFIYFSIADSSVAYAQTTPDQCRKLQKLYEEDKREELDLQRMIVIKNNEQEWQQHLLDLRRAVAGKYIVSDFDQFAPKLQIYAAPQDRLGIQPDFITLLERLIPEAGKIELSDLELKIDRNALRLSNYKKDMKTLKCDEVLEREKNASSSNLLGTWKFECCDKKYNGTFTLELKDGNKIGGYFGNTNNGTQGDIKNVTINGSEVSFDREWSGRKQHYDLTLSADGNTLKGKFSGDKDTTVGTDVTATKTATKP